MAAPSYDSVLTNVLSEFGVTNLKEEQRQMLDCLINEKDCMAILPTGFGKSLPFQIYLPVFIFFSEYSKNHFTKYIDKVVIIEIKQTCHTVWLHWEDISICFYLF